MSANENKRIAQELWTVIERAFAGEKVDMTGFLADDFRWTLPQSLMEKFNMPATSVGKEAAQRLLEFAPKAYVPGSANFTFSSWTAEEDRVFMHFELEATVSSTGMAYKNWYLAQMRFQDGLLAEMWEFYDTAHTLKHISL